MPKISEERRVLVALLILLVVGLLSVYFAFGRKAQIAADAPVEGPPSPACLAVTAFNVADFVAMKTANAPGFTSSDPVIGSRIEKLSAARTRVATDAPDYAELATARVEFIEHTLHSEPIPDDKRTDAMKASTKLVDAQRKLCPVTKPGTTTSKPAKTSTTAAAAP